MFNLKERLKCIHIFKIYRSGCLKMETIQISNMIVCSDIYHRDLSSLIVFISFS